MIITVVPIVVISIIVPPPPPPRVPFSSFFVVVIIFMHLQPKPRLSQVTHQYHVARKAILAACVDKVTGQVRGNETPGRPAAIWYIADRLPLTRYILCRCSPLPPSSTDCLLQTKKEEKTFMSSFLHACMYIKFISCFFQRERENNVIILW